MALYRVEGIVLGSRAFGEADRLVTLLTRERGRLRAVAKGARRPRSTLAAGVQPFTRGSYLLWQGRNLDGISQCEVIEGFRPLREDLDRMAHAACACELVEALTREADPVPALYDLLAAALRLLAGAEAAHLAPLLLAFQWQALAQSGFRPELERCAACGEEAPGGAAGFSAAAGGVTCGRCGARAVVTLSAGARAALRFLVTRPLPAVARLNLPAGDWRALAAATDAFVEHVLERPLKSRPFLEILREAPRDGTGGSPGEGGASGGRHPRED